MGSNTYPSSRSPASFSCLEHNYMDTWSSYLLGDLLSCEGTRHATSNDDKIGFGWQFAGSSMAREEFRWLAMPKGFRGLLRWQARPCLVPAHGRHREFRSATYLNIQSLTRRGMGKQLIAS